MSEEQLAANHAHAAQSTGPRSPNAKPLKALLHDLPNEAIFPPNRKQTKLLAYRPHEPAWPRKPRSLAAAPPRCLPNGNPLVVSLRVLAGHPQNQPDECVRTHLRAAPHTAISQRA